MKQTVIKDFITTHDVCNMFGVSKQTVYNWRQFSDLPFYTFQGEGMARVKFKEKEVLNWGSENDKKFAKDK